MRVRAIRLAEHRRREPRSKRVSPFDESIRLSLSSTFFGVVFSLSARTTDESFTSFSAMIP